VNKNLTDITLVVDRSGSMQSIREDAEGGVNSFIHQQQDQPGEATLTLVQFDNEYEFVHRGANVQNVGDYNLHPRGSTALLDAVGRAINETGERLSAMAESERPALVVFVIVTDGMENASREFKRSTVKRMIEHQGRVYSWKFLFLAANEAAFAEASGIGIARKHAVRYGKGKTRDAHGVVAGKVARMRVQASRGVEVQSEFTSEERAEME